jgi:hypothetical protein
MRCDLEPELLVPEPVVVCRRCRRARRSHLERARKLEMAQATLVAAKGAEAASTCAR